MPICPKLPLESGPALGTLSMCLKMSMSPPTSLTMSLKEGPVLKGNLENVFALVNAPSPPHALAHAGDSQEAFAVEPVGSRP